MIDPLCNGDLNAHLQACVWYTDLSLVAAAAATIDNVILTLRL